MMMMKSVFLVEETSMRDNESMLLSVSANNVPFFKFIPSVLNIETLAQQETTRSGIFSREASRLEVRLKGTIFEDMTEGLTPISPVLVARRCCAGRGGGAYCLL